MNYLEVRLIQFPSLVCTSGGFLDTSVVVKNILNIQMLFPRLPNSKSSSASLKRAGNGDLLGLPSCVPLRLPFPPQAQ